MKRRRSYAQEFDYYGVAAIGDYEYDDGVDKWEEIKEAFKNSKEIALKRTHGDVRNVGTIKHWNLDKTNKKVYVGFNKEDIDKDIKFDEINQVSIEYEILGDKIVKVNHICVGNTFKQKCPKKVCNITKQRGDEPEGETETPDVPDDKEIPEVPAEPEKTETEVEDKEEIKQNQTENVSNKILLERIDLLTNQVQELSKVKEKPKSDPEDDEDKKLKLGFKDKMKHELPSTENKPKSGELSRNWNLYKTKK